MPTYDYACSNCGHRFEEFQSMSSDPLKKCPKCQKNKLERLIGSGAGVIFKGSGFYETDYRSGSYAADKKKAETPGGGDQNSSGTKGGCQPTCGTSDAPAGCSAPKQD